MLGGATGDARAPRLLRLYLLVHKSYNTVRLYARFAIAKIESRGASSSRRAAPRVGAREGRDGMGRWPCSANTALQEGSAWKPGSPDNTRPSIYLLTMDSRGVITLLSVGAPVERADCSSEF